MMMMMMMMMMIIVIMLTIKGGSRVSSKSSRTQSEDMSHKKKSIKNSFLFQGKYLLYIHPAPFIVCLFFLKYAHKKPYTSRFSDQAKYPRKNIEILPAVLSGR